jgi:glutamyl-tRNA reductase
VKSFIYNAREHMRTGELKRKTNKMNLGDKESQDWSHMNINLVFSKEYAPVKHTKTKNELFMIFTCLRTEIRIRNLKAEKKNNKHSGCQYYPGPIFNSMSDKFY